MVARAAWAEMGMALLRNAKDTHERHLSPRATYLARSSAPSLNALRVLINREGGG